MRDLSLQFQSGLPVTSRSGAILKTTVVREKWELNNDDIELVSIENCIQLKNGGQGYSETGLYYY